MTDPGRDDVVGANVELGIVVGVEETPVRNTELDETSNPEFVDIAASVEEEEVGGTVLISSGVTSRGLSAAATPGLSNS